MEGFFRALKRRGGRKWDANNHQKHAPRALCRAAVLRRAASRAVRAPAGRASCVCVSCPPSSSLIAFSNERRRHLLVEEEKKNLL